MQKAFDNFFWRNSPSVDSPLNEQNLMKINNGLNTVDDRVITLDTTKFDKTDAQGIIKSLTFNPSNGVFTITYFNGATATIDTMLEKLAVNFDFDETTQQMIITLDDGTVKRVDLSAFIVPLEFVDSGTIAFQLLADGKVTAIVKEGSIEEKHLRPDYLADIRVETAKSEAYKNAAAISASTASICAYNAKESEKAAKESQIESKKSEQAAAQSAADSEANKNIVVNGVQTVSICAFEAKESAKIAKENADIAVENSANAAESAANAEDYADTAQSYAIGTNNVVRPNDSQDNSKFYSELARQLTDEAQKLLEQAQKLVSAATAGAIIPSGTVTFENLPEDPRVGYMYNISNDFVTDSRFVEGAGIFYRAGANIYWTKDGKWDVMVGTQVTGVKGEAESTYRVGNVNITKTNIGLGNVNNTADINKNVASAKTITETLPISKGGTGKTTGAEAIKELVNSATTGVDTPRDNDWYLCQWANGSSDGNQTPVRRKTLSLWNYIKSKIESIEYINTSCIGARKHEAISSGLLQSLPAGRTQLMGDGLWISNPEIKTDQGWIRMLGTGETDSVLEIATGDDGGNGGTEERIVVRQYNTANGVAHELVLLEKDGHTGFKQFVAIDTPNGTKGEIRLYRNGQRKMYIGTGNGNTNHGIWDYVLDKWMVYSDGANIYLNGTAEKAKGIQATNGTSHTISGQMYGRNPMAVMGFDTSGQINAYNTASLKVLSAIQDGLGNNIHETYVKGKREIKSFGTSNIEIANGSARDFEINFANVSSLKGDLVEVEITLKAEADNTVNKYVILTLEVIDIGGKTESIGDFVCPLPHLTRFLRKYSLLKYTFESPVNIKGFRIILENKIGNTLYINEGGSTICFLFAKK